MDELDQEEKKALLSYFMRLNDLNRLDIIGCMGVDTSILFGSTYFLEAAQLIADANLSAAFFREIEDHQFRTLEDIPF